MSKIRAVLYGLLLVLSLSGIAATAASAGAATGPAHYTKGQAVTVMVAGKPDKLVYLGAADPHQYCDPSYCPNAWFGGPLVKSYQSGVGNDAFQIFRDTSACNNGYTSTNCPISGNPTGYQIVVFQFQGGGTYNGDYIADYQNNQGIARAGLTGAGGWGWHFVLATYSGCVSGSFVYVNAHWSSSWNNQAWLGFSDGDGNQVYLNVAYPGGNCLIESSF